MEEVRFYQNSWFIAAMIFLCFPLGLYLMWKYADWDPASKVSISSLFVLICVSAYIMYQPIFASGQETQKDTHQVAVNEVAAEPAAMPVKTSDEISDIKEKLWKKYDLGEPHMIGMRGDTPLFATATKSAGAIDPLKWAVDYWTVYGAGDAEIYVFDIADDVTTRLCNNGENTLGLSIEQREGINETDLAAGESFTGVINVCAYAFYDKNGELVIDEIGTGYN